MKQPKFSSIFIAVGLFLFFLFFYLSFITEYVKKANVENVAESFAEGKIQGLIIQSKALADNELLPVYGSSELGAFNSYHPSNVFKGKPSGFIPFLIGRGGCQSLIHFLSFGATGQLLYKKKLVFIISPQWFGPKGLSEYYFEKNFSSIQAYKFINNSKISNELKTKAARRLLSFKRVYFDPILTIRLWEYAYPNLFTKAIGFLSKPLGYGVGFYLGKLDTLNSYKVFKNNSRNANNVQQYKILDWKQLLVKAEEDGKKSCTNNDFGIYNEYFDLYIKANFNREKGSNKNGSYLESLEYTDFQLVLNLLQEVKADPLFVIVPVNGLWYDYTGFPKENRDGFYRKIREQIRETGFKVADFSSHEYDRYFLQDVMHMGWKGWVYVDQAMEDHYRNLE